MPNRTKCIPFISVMWAAGQGVGELGITVNDDPINSFQIGFKCPIMHAKQEQVHLIHVGDVRRWTGSWTRKIKKIGNGQTKRQSSAVDRQIGGRQTHGRTSFGLRNRVQASYCACQIRQCVSYSHLPVGALGSRHQAGFKRPIVRAK
jgi:hypothetical protein